MSDEKLEQAVLDLSNNSEARRGDREIQRFDEAASPPSLTELSNTIMQSVGRALNDASRRVGEVMAEKSSFANDGDRRVAIALVSRLTQLLPMLEKVAEAQAEAEMQDQGFIPPCPMCGAKPGEHWAQDCPLVHDDARDNMVWDYGRNRLLTLKDFKTRKWEEDYGGKIPPCGVCGAGPGTHWAANCPENPIRHKMIADQVVPIERQLWYIDEQRKKMGLSTVPLD